VSNPSQAVRTDFRAPAGRLAAYLSQPEMIALSGSKKVDDADQEDERGPDLVSVRDLIDDVS
jgi:hypothetical protein